MDDSSPGPPKGFVGRATSNTNSVLSDINESNMDSGSKSVKSVSVAGTSTSVNANTSKNDSSVKSSSMFSATTNFSSVSSNNTVSNSELTDLPKSSSYSTGSSSGFEGFAASAPLTKNSDTISQLVSVISGSGKSSNPTSSQANSSHNNTIHFAGTITKTTKSLCAKCNNVIIDKQKAIQCSTCIRYTHYDCANLAIDDQSIKTLQRKTSYYYVCVKCSIGRVGIKLVDKDGNEISEEVNEYKKKIKFLEEYVNKLNKDINIVDQRNAQLDHQNKKLVGQLPTSGATATSVATSASSVADGSVSTNSFELENRNLKTQLIDAINISSALSKKIDEQAEEMNRLRREYPSNIADVTIIDDKDEVIDKLVSEVQSLKSYIDSYKQARREPSSKRLRSLSPPLTSRAKLTNRVNLYESGRQTEATSPMELSDDISTDHQLIDHPPIGHGQRLFENEHNEDEQQENDYEQQLNVNEPQQENATQEHDSPTRIIESMNAQFRRNIDNITDPSEKSFAEIMLSFVAPLVNVIAPLVHTHHQSQKVSINKVSNTAKNGPPKNQKTYRDMLANNRPSQGNKGGRPPSRGTSANRAFPPLQNLSKKEINQRITKQAPAQSKKDDRTFAEVVSKSKIKPSYIRSVTLIPTNKEELEELSDKLLSSYAATDVKILSIHKKSKDYIIYKCATESDATKLEDSLKMRFGPKVKVAPVKSSDPRFKIVGVSSSKIDPPQFLLNLKEQNPWLRNADISITDSFDIPTMNGKYKNIIIACDLQTLKRALEKGSVIVGLDSKNVFEYIEILQCFNCQRFGHVAATCRFSPCCKICSEDHLSRLCGEGAKPCCANCKRENKNGSSFNTNHRASDERCPSRSNRIEALKVFATKN